MDPEVNATRSRALRRAARRAIEGLSARDLRRREQFEEKKRLRRSGVPFIGPLLPPTPSSTQLAPPSSQPAHSSSQLAASSSQLAASSSYQDQSLATGVSQEEEDATLSANFRFSHRLVLQDTESVAESAAEPAAESVAESAAESAAESVAESAAESVAESAAEFVAESVAELSVNTAAVAEPFTIVGPVTETTIAATTTSETAAAAQQGVKPKPAATVNTPATAPSWIIDYRERQHANSQQYREVVAAATDPALPAIFNRQRQVRVKVNPPLPPVSSRVQRPQLLPPAASSSLFTPRQRVPGNGGVQTSPPQYYPSRGRILEDWPAPWREEERRRAPPDIIASHQGPTITDEAAENEEQETASDVLELHGDEFEPEL